MTRISNNNYSQPKISRRRRNGNAIADFAPALFVFLIIIIFPFIDLFGYLGAVATAALIANQCASTAAVSQTYQDALNATAHISVQSTNSCLGKFAHLHPAGGYDGSGVDLYIAVTDTNSNTTTVFGPDQPMNGAIDTTHFVYEYEAQVNFNVDPFISMAGIPIVGNLPIVGKPARFTFAVQKAAEYPDGLTSSIAANQPP